MSRDRHPLLLFDILYRPPIFVLSLSVLLTIAASVDPRTTYFPFEDSEEQECASSLPENLDGCNEIQDQLTICESRFVEANKCCDEYKTCSSENTKCLSRFMEAKNCCDKYESCLSENKKCESRFMEANNCCVKFEINSTSNKKYMDEYKFLLEENNKRCNRLMHFLQAVVNHARKDASLQKLTLGLVLTESDLDEFQQIISTKNCSGDVLSVLANIYADMPENNLHPHGVINLATLLIAMSFGFLLFLFICATVFRFVITIFVHSIIMITSWRRNCTSNFDNVKLFTQSKIDPKPCLNDQNDRTTSGSDKVEAKM